MPFKIGALKNFAVCTRNYLFWSLFLIQLQSSSPATILKSNSSTGVFLWTLQNFKQHLFWKTSANGCFWNLMKVLFDHEILSFWTCYEERISCGFYYMIASTHLSLDWKIEDLNQVTRTVLRIMWRFKKSESLPARKEKLLHEAGHVS